MCVKQGRNKGKRQARSKYWHLAGDGKNILSGGGEGRSRLLADIQTLPGLKYHEGGGKNVASPWPRMVRTTIYTNTEATPNKYWSTFPPAGICFSRRVFRREVCGASLPPKLRYVQADAERTANRGHYLANVTSLAEDLILNEIISWDFQTSFPHKTSLPLNHQRWALLGTLFDPCRLAYLAYTSNDWASPP